MSARYRYGELRLTRLNFYVLLFLRKFHFEQVYRDFFRQFYGPILFVLRIGIESDFDGQLSIYIIYTNI